MDGASATRLRFKSTASSRKRKRKHSSSHSHSNSHSHSQSTSSRRRSRSRSRSPKINSSKRHHRHRSRTRSRSPRVSTNRHHRGSKHNQSNRSEPVSSSTPLDYEFVDDDSHYSREEAYLREQEQEYAEQEQEYAEQYQQEGGDPWLSHLFDELANDDPFDYHSSRFSAQSSDYDRNNSGRGARINNLSDDAYASYMRRGMERTHQDKQNKEWEDWVQEQEKRRYKEAKAEQRQKDERRSRKRQERKERERLEAEMKSETSASTDNSPANKLRKQVLVGKARQMYESGWKMLIESGNDGVAKPLSMDIIPWPPLKGTQEESVETVSSSMHSPSSLSLFDFLFFGTTADQQDVRKQLLRREQLRFHPDKFKQRFGARLPLVKSENGSSDTVGTSERERILETVDRVARALNEMSELL